LISNVLVIDWHFINFYNGQLSIKC
jgi:hypothetical protein